VEEEKRRAQQRKEERLANAELIDNSNAVQRKKPAEENSATAQEDAKNNSFVNQLVTKIIDNVQISLKNVHVRYEDNVSNPEHPFAAGVTLSEISALSTSGDWEPTFISALTNTTHKVCINL
jgi:vacuolar protein sorting-associated protein 13A/C